MSKSFHKLHHRRVDTIIVIGVISLGAVIGLAVVIVIVVTSIATIFIVSTIVDVAMTPRPLESPLSMNCLCVSPACETRWD
eukprot:6415221-Pyramimonas_sp.AAC.1